MTKFNAIAIASLLAIAGASANAALVVSIGTNGQSVTVNSNTVSLQASGVIAPQSSQTGTFTNSSGSSIQVNDVTTPSTFAFTNLAGNGAPSFNASTWELDGKLTFNAATSVSGPTTIANGASYSITAPAVVGGSYVTAGDVASFVSAAASLLNTGLMDEVVLINGKVGNVTLAANAYNNELRYDQTEAEAGASTTGAALKAAYSDLTSEIASSKPAYELIKTIKIDAGVVGTEVILGYTITEAVGAVKTTGTKFDGAVIITTNGSNTIGADGKVVSTPGNGF